MALDTSCYTAAIGLARASCPCADAVDPELSPAFNESNSGLYIADLPPLSDLGGFEDCSAGSVWDILSQSRDKAVRTFISDSNSALPKIHRARRSNWAGGIGRAENRGDVSGSDLYAGIRLSCAPIRGGEIKITKIGGFFKAGGDLTIYVYDRHNALRKTVTITVAANAHTVVTLPADDIITLPLFDDYLSQQEYFIVYERSAAPGTAIENRFTCNCGNSFRGSFDTANPYYKSGMLYRSYGQVTGWADWLLAGGWEGDSLAAFDCVTSTAPDRAFGLTLYAEIRCKASEILCNGTLDYEQNPLALSIAQALQFKAAEYAALSILSSSRLNRNNLINREALIKLQAQWREHYDEYLNFIIGTADTSLNDCLVCRSVASMQKQGVLS